MKKKLMFLLITIFANNCYGSEFFADAKKGWRNFKKGIQVAGTETNAAEVIAPLGNEIVAKSGSLSGMSGCMGKCPGVLNAIIIINNLNEALKTLKQVVFEENVAAELEKINKAIDPMLKNYPIPASGLASDYSNAAGALKEKMKKDADKPFYQR
jgi:hypothetical protein